MNEYNPQGPAEPANTPVPLDRRVGSLAVADRPGDDAADDRAASNGHRRG